jgi:hypothetical protein
VPGKDLYKIAIEANAIVLPFRCIKLWIGEFYRQLVARPEQQSVTLDSRRPVALTVDCKDFAT